jgi:ribosome-binding factor A
MTRRRPHRAERLAHLVQETLAEAIATALKDPRVGFVTITSVRVTADAQQATVRVSVLGTEDEKGRAIEGLDRARGFLRSYLAERLELRVTPELRFELDRGLEYAQRIDALLKQIRREGEPS